MRRGILLSPTTRSVLLLLYLGYTLLPILWLILSTVQTQASILAQRVAISPAGLTLHNYVEIFRPAAFGEV
jgi:ABC-type glycerol-3-phosphate transport system permease component